MVQQSLVEYIRRLLQQGYDPGVIRTTLLNAGYSPYDVDAGMRAAGGVPRKIGSTVLIVSFLIILVLAGGVLIVLKLLQAPPVVLDVSVTLFSSQLAPGQELVVNTDISNPSGKSTSGLIDFEVSGPAGRVAAKTESFNVGQRTSVPVSILIPVTAELGSYVVNVKVSYANHAPLVLQKNFDVVERAVEVPAAAEALKKEAEETARELQLTCPGGCEDLNFCTTDNCVQGECVNSPIVPCCGNGQCESGESAGTCMLDCAERPISPDEIRKRAVGLAVSDIGGAVKLCDSLAQRAYIDLCLSEVAQEGQNKEPCASIVDSDVRDGCYIVFAYNNDFSVCGELKNPYMKNSCTSLEAITAAKG